MSTHNRSNQVTVLIIDEQSTQSKTLNRSLLKSIKPLIFGLGTATAVSAATASHLFYLQTQHQSETNQYKQEINSLNQEIVDLQNLTSEEINSKIKSLQNSERTVQALQKYLKDRGVKAAPVAASPKEQKMTDAAGGPEIKLAAPIPYAEDYRRQTERLLEQARKIPLGIPHTGSISSGFGPRSNPFGKASKEMHLGLDFRGNIGENIRATADGTVSTAGMQNGYGRVVKIDHGYGYQTVYAHLSAINVATGDKIKAGDVIGKLGNSGRSTGSHLHYEVRLNGSHLDPEHFLTLDK